MNPNSYEISVKAFVENALIFVEKVVDGLRHLLGDAVNGLEIGCSRPANGLRGAEMLQKRSFAGRSNSRHIIQGIGAGGFFAPGAVGADGEAVRLVAKTLHEIENRVARLQHEGRAAAHEKPLTSGVAVRPLGDGGDIER